MNHGLKLMLIATLALGMGAGCVARVPIPSAAPPAAASYPEDPHSYSRPNEVLIEHLDLDLSVNFPAEKLVGVASLVVHNRAGASELWLDSRDLAISRVTLGSEMAPTTFRLGEEQGVLGRALIIAVEPGTRRVNIEYETSPGAAALQWLDPAMTAGGQWPFLFTQSQAILARTWIPLQDTPAVRFTYNATVRAPQPLMAVMSAENPTAVVADGIYRFKMEQPIPSYLMALAVGDLVFRDLGGRAGVYAEPSVIERAAWEFADTPKMMRAAEEMYGPYQWGRYDILVLPPSFPFGGMENPRLTFATPTIIAGDRSLVSLVAHELAHSWSGNLVTNATWDDFWLNEGFTTYFENRIMEAVFGKEQADLLAALGQSDLEKEVAGLGATSADTHLKLNLAGRDPDEGMTNVAYEKGSNFLKLIEETVGRERFDAFLRSYFDAHEFQSITTERFVEILRRDLLTAEEAAAIDVDAWVYGPGIPANLPKATSSRIAHAREQAEQFVWGRKPAELKTEGWGTQEWLLFLRALPKLGLGQMADLDRGFKFTESGNSEILSAWLLKALESSYEPAYPALEKFLTSMGRRKFLEPLYREMVKTPQGRQRAARIYERARETYHPVSQQTIDEIMKSSQSAS
ncbi:MAG TPA: M1 family metallopeptidase [Thermoanaerobaculia bacterium]|nr:M1 family metallopeptidase [Thermoanaerobaculia bacterium]